MPDKQPENFDYRPRLVDRLGVFFCGMKEALERYIRLLELQEMDIAGGETDVLSLRCEQEQSAMREILGFRNAILPLEALLGDLSGEASGTSGGAPIGRCLAAVKSEIEALRLAALGQQEKNRLLSAARLEEIGGQLEASKVRPGTFRRTPALSPGDAQYLNITA